MSYALSFHDIDRGPISDFLANQLPLEVKVLKDNKSIFIAGDEDEKLYFRAMISIIRDIRSLLHTQRRIAAGSSEITSSFTDQIASEYRPSIESGEETWKQFLSPGAPAVPILERDAPLSLLAGVKMPKNVKLIETAVIVLPPAANTILDNWINEYEQILGPLREASTEVLPWALSS